MKKFSLAEEREGGKYERVLTVKCPLVLARSSLVCGKIQK
jgi:hypothetical protein